MERAEPKFPAMQLLDDPHRLCDALLARARRQVDAFEQRVARLDLCSRVACTSVATRGVLFLYEALPETVARTSSADS